MFARLIVPAVAAALVVSTAAFAAGSNNSTVPPAKDQNRVQTAAMKSAARCTSLEAQFDEAIKTHGNATKERDARMMRTEGGSLCAKGQHTAGAIKIEQALKELGVTPNM